VPASSGAVGLRPPVPFVTSWACWLVHASAQIMVDCSRRWQMRVRGGGVGRPRTTQIWGRSAEGLRQG
jgi:hypothetical protein